MTLNTDAKATLNQMQSYLAESTEAVKANYFARAKTEFEEFDESWENADIWAILSTSHGCFAGNMNSRKKRELYAISKFF